MCESDEPPSLFHPRCMICLDEAATDLVHLCSSDDVDDSQMTCKECLISYVDNKVNSAFCGFCPLLNCPSHNKMLMNYSELALIIGKSTLETYEHLADTLLQFRCAICHCTNSIAVSSHPEPITQLPVDKDICFIIQKYSSGYMTTDAMFAECNRFLIRSEPSDTLDFKQFAPILLEIANRERRTALHLRFLREYPIFYTPCCYAKHCFTCKTYGDHEGLKCEENDQLFGDSILPCPSCGISLTKGEGCDYVTCVCGYDFNWSEEIEIYERAQMFEKDYPVNTAEECAKIIWNTVTAEITVFDAYYWQQQHRLEVNRKLLHLWATEYPTHTSQCCLVVRTTTYGQELAKAQWKQEYRDEVQRLENQQSIALASLFESLYMECDRQKAAKRILSEEARDPELIKSVSKWIEVNAKAEFPDAG